MKKLSYHTIGFLVLLFSCQDVKPPPTISVVDDGKGWLPTIGELDNRYIQILEMIKEKPYNPNGYQVYEFYTTGDTKEYFPVFKIDSSSYNYLNSFDSLFDFFLGTTTSKRWLEYIKECYSVDDSRRESIREKYKNKSWRWVEKLDTKKIDTCYIDR